MYFRMISITERILSCLGVKSGTEKSELNGVHYE